MVTVKIPTPLRKFTNEQGDVDVSGADVKAIIEDLEKKFPGIKKRLCEENGSIRRFINIYIGDEDIRFLQGLNTKVEAGKEINIVPAIAGG